MLINVIKNFLSYNAKLLKKNKIKRQQKETKVKQDKVWE